MQNELLLGEDLELELSGEDQSAQTVVHDWPCNCLLCRVFVRPMFGMLTKILERKLEGVEAESRQELESKAEEGVEGFVKKVRKAGVEVKAVSISKSQGEDESEGEVTEEVGEENISEGAGEPKDLGKIPELAGIIERIEALENEVQALKTGVASTIEGIKSTLVDLRAAVAEVSNPFNIMRKYAELIGLSTQQVQAAQPVQQVARPQQITTPVSSGDALLMMQQLRKHEHKTEAYEGEKDVKEIDIDEDRIKSEKQQGSKEERSSEESSISLEDVLSLDLPKDKEGSGRSSLRHSSEKKEEEKHEDLGGEDEMEEFTPLTLESLVTSKSAKKLGLGRLIKLVKWIDAILERMPEDSLEDIVKFATNIGILTRDDADLILKALALVIKTREGGLRIDDQLIALYMLAKIFGIEDKEADGEVVKLAVNRDDLLDRFIKP